MTRSRRHRDAIAPSLFPFLAVLLCTMGSLVLILMLIVAGAQASTRRVTQAVEEEIEFRTAAVELKEKSLQKDLEESRIEVEKKRLALQHVENHIQDTLDELDELQKKKKLLEEETASGSDEEQERKLTELERQLAEAKEQLEQLSTSKPAGDKPIFAIIPYEGRNGTHRRPIYLECVDGKLIIQPEGVELGERDLQPPYGPGNPLDAALRTIRSEFAPANGAVTSTAYPLLIVRPSGILAYLRARRAMSGWDDQFGYELVDEELELAFPESKSGLKQQIAKSLDLARERQAAIAMAMPRTYRGTSGQFANDGFGGGSGASTGSSSYGSNSSGSGAYASDRGSATSGGGRGGFSDGFSNDFASEERYAASGDAIEEILSGASGFGGQAGRTNGSTTETGMQSGSGSVASSGDSLLGMGSSRGATSDLSGGGEDGSAFGNGLYGGASAGESNGSSSGGVPGGSSTGAGTSGSPGGGASGGGAAQAGGQQVGIPTFGLGANAGGQHGSSNQTGQVAQDGSSRGGSPGGTSQNSSGSRRGQGGSSGSSSNSAGGQRSGSSGDDTKPVAATRGRDWAWSGGSATLTPVSRSIDMKCTSEAWILPASRAGEKTQQIPYEGTPLQRAEKLAELIHNRVESWGFALEGGYWRPELVVEVTPGAKWRYDQLVRLFEGSGLRIRGKYAQPTGQVTLPRRDR